MRCCVRWNNRQSAIDKSFDYLLDSFRVNVPDFIRILTRQK